MFNRKLIINKSSTIMILFMTIILFLTEEAFYFINNESMINKKLVDINIIVVGVFFLYINIKYKQVLKYSFVDITIIFLFLIISSSISNNLEYGQPVILSLRPQRYLALIMLYFPLVKILLVNKSNIIYLKKIIVFFSVITMCIYSLEYILVNIIGTTIFYVPLNYRADGYRLLVNFVLQIISICIVFEDYCNNTKKRNINMFLIIVHFIYLAIVLQYRMVIISLLITLIIGLNIQDKISKIKINYFITILVIISIIIFIYKDIELITKYINLTISEIQNKTGSVGVRLNAIEYYINQLKNSFMFGRGVFNNTWSYGEFLEGTHLGYYLSDLGWFGFVVIYGVCGFIWIIYMILKIMIINIKNSKIYGNYSITCFIIFTILASPTIITFYYKMNPIYLAIILAIVDYYKIIRIKENSIHNKSKSKVS